MSPGDLSQIFSHFKQHQHKNLVIGFESNEDCGIYRLGEQGYLLQSVDFITPIVDDPYSYGKIAAANALSDIFAMGAEAQTALNLLMWDRENVCKEALQEILRGGMDKIIECNASLLGGHTINDKEQKYGLSVTGVAQRFWRNNSANVGDVLLLCKPIGSGIITTALKQELIKSHSARDCISSMELLNLYASRDARDYPISACTDITGFGLIGHLLEMCREDLGILLEVEKIPLFEKTKELMQKSLSGGSQNNKKYFEKHVRKTLDLLEDDFLYDAQTSGGIVFALPRYEALKLLDRLKKSKYEHASIIGEFIPRMGDEAIVLG